MPLDLATFLRHTPDAEKTTVYVPAADEADDDPEPIDALLIAQTAGRKLFVTLETPRRYLTHTRPPDGEQDEQDEDEDGVELDLLPDYQEVEALLEDAGLYGRHEDGLGILYHNLLFLLLNP